MNNKENDNHILIEVLNKNVDLKLTKFRNPRAIWQNYDYPDEYTFRDVDIVNVFQLQKENQELKKENKILRENAENNDKVVDKANWENLKLKEHIEKYEHYCKTTGIEELMKENQKYKEEIDKAIEYITIYRSYENINGKDYLKGRDEIGTLSLSQVDKLLDILKEVE